MSELPSSVALQTAAATEAAARLTQFLRTNLAIGGSVALHEPSFEGREWAYVKECLDIGWVSSAGKFVERFETMTAAACGAAHGVAVVNGTAGLHAALLAAGVRDRDAVICPALTFIATANAISYCGAVPLFVDIEDRTLGIDSAKLAAFLDEACETGPEPNDLRHRDSGRRIAAILPVHVFGHPADMDGLLDLAARHRLPVIEDAAEALGSRHRRGACGTLGAAGVISFNGNKTLTTGGGGVIVTNDADLARRLKHLTTTARTPHRWWYDHDAVGFNYRMPNINAALGCAQMELLPQFLARKRRLAEWYDKIFAGLNGVEVLREPAGCRSNYWLNALLFKDAPTRDLFLELTNNQGIETRPCWRLIPDTTAYQDALRAADLTVSRDIVSRVVNIPSGPCLNPDDIG